MPFVYSVTLVIQGHGVAQVIGTGIHTEIGEIGKALGTIAVEDSLIKLSILKSLEPKFDKNIYLIMLKYNSMHCFIQTI